MIHEARPQEGIFRFSMVLWGRGVGRSSTTANCRWCFSEARFIVSGLLLFAPEYFLRNSLSWL